MLSTLCEATCTDSAKASPTNVDNSLLFSYPQCRIVDKATVGESEYSSMSVYPDLGLIYSVTETVEKAKLLIEVKRLYRDNESK